MDQRHKIAISEMVSERTPRPLMGPLLTFEFAAEADALRNEAPWHTHGHNARTLLKHSEFRLVLIVLGVGRQLHESEVGERLALQTLRGRVVLHVPTERFELQAGQLVALDRHIPYSIEAIEESELLLWLGWSKE